MPCRPRGSHEGRTKRSQKWSAFVQQFDKFCNKLQYLEWWKIDERPTSLPHRMDNSKFLLPHNQPRDCISRRFRLPYAVTEGLSHLAYKDVPEIARNYWRHIGARLFHFVERLELTPLDRNNLVEYSRLWVPRQWKLKMPLSGPCTIDPFSLPTPPAGLFERMFEYAQQYQITCSLPVPMAEIIALNAEANEIVDKFDLRFAALGLTTNYLVAFTIIDKLVETCWDTKEVGILHPESVRGVAERWIRCYPLQTIEFTTTPHHFATQLQPYHIVKQLARVGFFEPRDGVLLSSPHYKEKAQFRTVETPGGIMVDPNYIRVTETKKFSLECAQVPILPLLSPNNKLCNLLYSIIHNDSILACMPQSAEKLPCILHEFGRTYLLSAFVNLSIARLEQNI